MARSLIFSLLLLLSTCMNAQDMLQEDSLKTKVYFIFPYKYGKKGSVKLVLNDSTTIKINSNSYYSFTTSSPSFSLRLKNGFPHYSTIVNLKPGESYYFRCKSLYTTVHSYECQRIAEEVGIREIQTIEYSKTLPEKRTVPNLPRIQVDTKAVLDTVTPSPSSHIYIYRPNSLVGAVIPILVTCNDSVLFDIKNYSSYDLVTNGSQVNLKCVNPQSRFGIPAPLVLNLTPGSIHFVYVSFYGMRIIMEEIPKEYMLKKLGSREDSNQDKNKNRN